MVLPFGLGAGIAWGLYHQFRESSGLEHIGFGVYMLFIGVAMAITVGVSIPNRYGTLTCSGLPSSLSYIDIPQTSEYSSRCHCTFRWRRQRCGRMDIARSLRCTGQFRGRLDSTVDLVGRCWLLPVSGLLHQTSVSDGTEKDRQSG